MAKKAPPVVLFGYESSTFTLKVRLALKIKQIPYTFVTVPSMMPRPLLRDNFHLTYRKIPVLSIGREVYCDTSIILEALEYYFSEGHPSLYPPAADGRNYRPFIRGFASYWTDRPLFRVTTGLIPASVWRTSFGTDRAQLIGHKLDPDKLEAKVPRNLVNLDTQLSMLEPLFHSDGPWLFSTKTPSAGDISLFYQLEWGLGISKGYMMDNLTDGGTGDTDTPGASIIFNAQRYPAAHKWFTEMHRYFDALPSSETHMSSLEETMQQMRAYKRPDGVSLLIKTPNESHHELERGNGLQPGAEVSVAPDDTGRDNPTLGTLVAISPEEVVIKPKALDGPASVDVQIHFPRIGFVVKPVDVSKM